VSDPNDRLIKCFMSVFPVLTAQEIRETSAESSGVWDSLSGVTLAAVVQEEFSVEIDPARIPELDSFEAYRHYLSRLE
jgi:acyl carrier protein